MQPGWVDAPHYELACGDFPLDSGEAIEDFRLSFAAHGDLADDRLPAVAVLCAIASTHHRLDFLIGPGRALDPARMRILAIDAIGNGLSSSPSNSTGQPGAAFPRFTVRDMVRSQKRLADHLGIARLHAVVGASMGGMQALQWGVTYPGAVGRIVALTPMARATAWSAAANLAARQALQAALDACLPGAPHPPGLWDGWSAVMQILCAQTPEQVDGQLVSPARMRDWLAARSAGWRAQGFDPLDWIHQSWAYDAHDVGAADGFRGDAARALGSIRARTLIAAPPLDLYNPVHAAKWAAAHIPDCAYREIDSIAGHWMASADAGSAAELNRLVGDFLV